MAIPVEIRRLLGTVRRYQWWLALAVALMAIVGAAEGLTAMMVSPAVDRVIEPQSPGSSLPLPPLPWNGRVIDLKTFFPPHIHNPWTVFAISILVIFAIKGIAEFAGVMIVQTVGLAVVTDLRNRLFAKVTRQPIGFFQHNPIGRLTSAVTNDVERVRNVVSDWLADSLHQLFSLIAFTSVLFIVNWRMALGSLVLLPLVAWPIGKLGRSIRKSAEKSQTRLGELTQIVQENVAGNRVVKAFGMEDFETGKFKETGRRWMRANLRWVAAYVATSPMMDLLGAVVICLVLLYARDQIRHGVMTPGTFMAFVFALFSAYAPVKRMGSFYQQLEQARGATMQVFNYLSLEEEQQDQPGAVMLPPFSREIEFDNVSFAYDGHGDTLRQIRLTARAGEVIAIVGSSGAGKSTLVNMLPRFYAPTGGVLRIDGCDIRDVNLRALREQIAIVTQETILFNETIWNNICYGRPAMPRDRVIAAAKAALAHDFIEQMPQGYESLIGDRGQRLSGGQRQRIAIARALLKDSPILILDEATSELDSESEMAVQDALGNLMVGRTSFVIAHRLSTVRRADKIVVLDEGTIREIGTHQELLARGGLYARLYEMQFADVDAAPAAREADQE